MNQNSIDLVQMGQRGRQWMQRDFDWAAIAQQMVQAYHWLLEGGNPPGCIRLE
jgi:hypothetical protein